MTTSCRICRSCNRSSITLYNWSYSSSSITIKSNFILLWCIESSIIRLNGLKGISYHFSIFLNLMIRLNWFILIYPRWHYCMIKIRSNRTCCCTSSCRFKYFCSENSIILCPKYFGLFVSSRSHIYKQKLLSSHLLDFKKTCSISKF